MRDQSLLVILLTLGLLAPGLPAGASPSGQRASISSHRTTTKVGRRRSPRSRRFRASLHRSSRKPALRRARRQRAARRHRAVRHEVVVQQGSAQTKAPRSTLRRLGQRLKRGCKKACEVGKRLGAATKRGAIKGTRWARKHPLKALGLGLGTAAMLTSVFYAAPLLSGAVSTWLTPHLGVTTANILGIASGGALASGSRSLLVHSTPMVIGLDPFNRKQLATDVGMSSAFGFGGFAQAAGLRQLTMFTGAGGLALFGINAVGLIGYEVGKDYFQNRIRNRVATDPKSFRKIWKSSLVMETVSNLHRCIPGLGLETNFGAKILGDIGGTIWWDRIINKRNTTPSGKKVAPTGK